MPIQIIDNFDLTTAKPIDNRIVVGPAPSFYLNKDDIPNKYQGMRIWELPGADLGSGVTNSTANGLAYVWTGTSWISENTTSISGSGTVGRVAYFSSANSIQSSNIYFANNNIGIGANAESTTGAKLFVSGDIKTSTKFVGPGTGITNINASNIDNGTLNVLRFGGDANNNWILTSNNVNSASYKNPTTINVGSATTLQTTRSIWGKSFNGSADISGDITVNGNVYRAMSLGLLSGGVNNSGSKIATFQFSGSATSNKTVIIPNSIPNSSTLAFLEHTQTWSSTNTFGSSTIFNGVVTANQTVTVNNTFTVNQSSQQRLKVNYDNITIGPNSVGSPFVRVGNNTVTSAPSYTWWGNDNTGMYRPSSDVVGFVTAGSERMRITNTGVYIGGKLSVDNTPGDVGGNVLTLNGKSSNHCYVEFKSNAQVTRSAYVGFPTSNSDIFRIENERGKVTQIGGIGGANALNIAINNGTSPAPPEVSGLSGTYGLYVYAGGWKKIKASDFDQSSDIRLKKDIESITTGSLKKALSLNPVKYKWIQNDETTMGFIAQELLQVLPELVNGDLSKIDDGDIDERDCLSINISGIVAILAGAIKELSDEVNKLKS